MREIERVVLLKVIDNKWMSHIDDMDQLREGIGLQAYGNRDPLVEYKMNAYEMFDDMTAAIREDTIRILCHIRVEEKVERGRLPRLQVQTVTIPRRELRRDVRHRKSTRMIRVRADPARNINSAAEENR